MVAEILLVEDDDDTAIMLRHFLEIHGYATAWVSSGYLAVELVRRRRSAQQPAPALILLDLSLPDVDGTAIVDELNTDGVALPPIVVTSARPDHDIISAARHINAAAFARKPFSLHQMLRTIQDVIDRP